jgi:small subunit ribosomal protein S8
MNDKIADMLIRIKNAGVAGKESTMIPHSNLRLSIAEALLKRGYITSVAKKGKKTKKTIEIGIAYKEGCPKVKEVERISKLSRRVYYGFRDIRPINNGFGLLMLSTPKGILSGEEAKKENVGGEALFKIW